MSDPQINPVNMVDARTTHSGFRPLSSIVGAHCDPVIEEGVGVDTEDPYTSGFQDGQDSAIHAFEIEKLQLNALMATAAALQSEPSEELAVLIAHTVLTLVSQIVGDAPVDRDWLNAKAQMAAALIEECDDARTMWVHPDDMALLDTQTIGLELQADPNAARGSIRIDCSSGWIDHGRTQYLDALQSGLGLAGDRS